MEMYISTFRNTFQIFFFQLIDSQSKNIDLNMKTENANPIKIRSD